MFRNLLGRMFGGAKEGRGPAENHIPFADPVHDEEIPFAEPAPDEPEFPLYREPNIELVDFEGRSEDIEWMTFNHDTGEVIVSFLEHGEKTKHAHVYSYKDIPYSEFTALSLGSGPFPSGREPHYTKPVSVGQAMNFYIRADHADDLYEYERLEQERIR
jgi:hypothetical protein